MSGSNVSVGYIALKAKEATEEKNRNKQGKDQSELAKICRNFIIQREDEWRREAEKYTMLKLCVLYDLLPSTSNNVENTLDADVVENTLDAYIEPKKILLHRMRRKVDNMPKSEKWKPNSPKDHYYILNEKIGEV